MTSTRALLRASSSGKRGGRSRGIGGRIVFVGLAAFAGGTVVSVISSPLLFMSKWIKAALLTGRASL